MISLHLLITIFTTFLITCRADNDPCDSIIANTPLHDCQDTEYEAYYKCIESQKIQREKHVVACQSVRKTRKTENTVNDIAVMCQKRNVECTAECAENVTCQAECPVCPMFVNENATETTGYRTVIVEGTDGNGDERVETKIEAGRNVTTVIRLTNLINNTNTIHAPTNVTTTNLNNIHIYPKNSSSASSNDTGGEFGLGYNEHGSCCMVSRPKSCVQTTVGQRCNYERRKTCGPKCTSKTIHVTNRKRSKHGRFVPQPRRQPCVSIDQWPYVSCGGSFGGSCDGCYEYDDEVETNDKGQSSQCRGCYDDGFDSGPLYRRGPVLRPFAYQLVPCYIVGMCYPVAVPAYFPAYDDYDAEADEGNVSKVNDDDEGWQTDVYKCKVVSDDGTIEIKNCTSSNLNENPYATYPVNSEIQSETGGAVVPQASRSSRHIGRRRSSGRSRNSIVFDESDQLDGWNRNGGERIRKNRQKHRNSKRNGRRERRKSKIIYDDDVEFK